MIFFCPPQALDFSRICQPAMKVFIQIALTVSTLLMVSLTFLPVLHPIDPNIGVHFFKIYFSFLLAPSIFEVILNIVRPVLSAGTRRSLQVYGPSSGWESKVFATIDRDQVRPAFSGTKEN
jgi:hypothetical protein